MFSLKKRKTCKHELPRWWQLLDSKRGTFRLTDWRGVIYCRICEKYFDLDGVELRFLGMRRTIDQEYATWQVGESSTILFRPNQRITS